MVTPGKGSAGLVDAWLAARQKTNVCGSLGADQFGLQDIHEDFRDHIYFLPPGQSGLRGQKPKGRAASSDMAFMHYNGVKDKVALMRRNGDWLLQHAVPLQGAPRLPIGNLP